MQLIRPAALAAAALAVFPALAQQPQAPVDPRIAAAWVDALRGEIDRRDATIEALRAQLGLAAKREQDWAAYSRPLWAPAPPALPSRATSGAGGIRQR